MALIIIAIGVFRVNNLVLKPLAEINLADLNAGVREWVGLLVYRRSDRTETFFPQGSE